MWNTSETDTRTTGWGGCSGGQTRTFAYDKLGRLTSATNPENGTVRYTYDGNGNVLTKTDGRGTDGRGGTVTHTYDALNRVKTTRYSGGGTDFSGTPGVTYTYDAGSSSACKNKGRLTSVAAAGVSTTSYGCYDKLGRVTASTQTTAGDAARTFAYEYNADGTVKTQTYPSGLKVAYEYDEAGRPKAVGKNTVGKKEYASEMAYAAHGGLRTMKLGNGLYESRGYNARMQPTAIRVGTSTSEADRANRLSLSFDYGTTANNGNVLSQTIGRAGMSGTLTQYYRYDGANRLGLASEGGTAPTGASGCPTNAVWCRDYSYDAYGNRAVTGVRGHTLPAAAPSAVSAFSVTTNRMTAGSYDAAGNLTLLTGVGRLGYDAENRLKTFDNAVASVQEQGTYVYDGLGQRVKRTTTIRGTSETTVYVYDAFGQLTAEYSSKAPAAGSGGRFFITQDHLGSTRLVTKQDTEKTVVECRDFFPFGERIASGLNGRSLTCYGGGNAVKQQFTGKERDVESSLDYFGARYYSARLGRFTGVDPLLNSGRPGAPQSWNRYSYSLNNPLTFTDPTGLYVCQGTKDECSGFKTTLESIRQTLEESSLDRKSAKYKRLNAALQSYGDYDEKNGVTVDFKKSDNFAAITNWNEKGDITVFFDPVKFQDQNHDGRAILVAHEGSHVSDISALFGKGIQSTEYILEKRGYEVSSFAAEALGLQNWRVGESIIWNAEWRTLDFSTLIKNRTININEFLKFKYRLSSEIQGNRVP